MRHTSKHDIPKKNITKAGLRNAFQLYRFIRPYRLEYLIGILFLFGSSLANLAFPKLLGELVTEADTVGQLDNINRIALILAGLLFIQALFSYFRVILFVNVTEKSLAALRQHTYRHLIRLPIRFFDQRRVGELNSRISADISLLQDTMTTTLAEFVRQIIIIVGGIALLTYTSFKLTLFMLAIIPAVVILAVIFGRFIRKYSKEAQAEVADSNTIVEETLQGIRSVKTYTNEFFEILRYKNKTEKIARIGIKGGKYRGAFSAFLIFGLFGALVAVIWQGSRLLAAGELNSGELFSFVLYSGFIGGTIGGMAGVYTQIQKFLGATEDLFEIFEEKTEAIEELKELSSDQYLNGNIEFKDVSFSYPSRPDETVISNINLSVQPNQLIALVGASGAGKSTITALLMRLHDISSGELLFDGKDSRSISLTALRSQIALVPQDIFLFGGTIRENIAYGKPEADDHEIIQAAKQANAWEFISRFPETLDTVVGERGTQLSGGQRQRIAIARAVLKNPKILVLDEATSALDSESERLVQSALEKLMTGRTSIVIAHRLATVRNADQIFVMEKGQIVEQGSHEALIKIENGVYRKLSTLQTF